MDKETLGLQEAVVTALLNKKALNVVSMDVTNVMPLADSFIIASGNSSIHMNALVNAVTDCLDMAHVNYRVEGAMSTDWALVDAGSVIVHIFSVRGREYYKLERIWGDTEVVHYENHD